MAPLGGTVRSVSISFIIKNAKIYLIADYVSNLFFYICSGNFATLLKILFFMSKTSLGQRLNNPLNIRYSKGNKWLGQTASYRRFCVFESSDYGLRAAMLLIERYIVFNHLRYVSGIIYRFAPSVENDSEAYISYVKSCLDNDGIDSSCPIKPYTYAFYLLIRSMAFYESKFIVSVQYLVDLATKFHLNS